MRRIFIYLPFVIKLVVLSSLTFAQNEKPSSLAVSDPAVLAQEEVEKNFPSYPAFDRQNPKAKGIILSFKVWPLSKEQKNQVLKKTKPESLKETSSIKRFKVIVFEWENWREGQSAIDLCVKFLDLSFLDYCEPAFLQGPATGIIRKKAKKKIVKGIRHHQEHNPKGNTTEPTTGSILKPREIFSTDKSGDIKSCEITPSSLGLLSGRLSDYWAQEMIGSDLMKEELEHAPPVKKHLVAVFDTPSSRRHDIGVKKLISDEGRHAVLPKIGNSMTTFNTSISPFYLQSADHLLSTAEQKCKSFSRSSESGGALQ